MSARISPSSNRAGGLPSYGSRGAVPWLRHVVCHLGVHGEVDQAVVIVESFFAVGVFILRLGFGVVLPQPSPRQALTGAMTRPGSFRVVFRVVCSPITSSCGVPQ
jgi:hypothetical protein